MKSKKMSKLSLNKTTVAQLNGLELNSVKGGLPWTDPRACDTDYTCYRYTISCPTLVSEVPEHCPTTITLD